FQGNGSDSLIITGPVTLATFGPADPHNGSVVVDGHSISYSNMSGFEMSPGDLTPTTPANNTVNCIEGNAFSNQVLTTFDDANPHATAADFRVTSVSYTGNPTFTSGPTYVVQSASSASGGKSHWQVVVSGTVAEAGNYTATVNVSDVDGSTVSDGNTT